MQLMKLTQIYQGYKRKIIINPMNFINAVDYRDPGDVVHVSMLYCTNSQDYRVIETTDQIAAAFEQAMSTKNGTQE
jgi:hypothetical protein